MKRLIVYLCGLVLLLTGCQAVVTVTPPAEPSPTVTPAAEIRPALGEDFSLKAGETARFEEVGLQLTFTEVVRDSRCPADVQCVWSGIVDVQLTAELPPQPAESFVVGGTTDREGNVLGSVVEMSGPTEWWYAGHTVTLKQVTPYPKQANAPIPPANYTVTLVVEPAKPGDPTPTSPAPTATPFVSDPGGRPLLCLSEQVLTARVAGASEESPARLTPPVAKAALADWPTTTVMCSGLFGADFHIASTTDLSTTWTEYLPADTTYWVWDATNGQVVAAP